MDQRDLNHTLHKGLKFLPYATMAALLAWYAGVMAYAWYIHPDFISRDQWRFLDMVDQFMSGHLSWRTIWSGHSEHVKPVYKFLFLLNAKYLGLNVMAEIVSGLLLLGAAVVLLMRDMAGSLQAAWREPGPLLALLTAGLVFMSFNQQANYVYGLLALGGFGGTLVQLWFFSGFSRALNQATRPAARFGYAVILMVAVLGLSGARSPAVVGACAMTLFLAYWLMPQDRRRLLREALPLLLLGFVLVGLYVLLIQTRRSVGGPLPDELSFILHNPRSAIGYVSGLLAESALNLYGPGSAAQSHVWHVLAALAAYVLLGWALWRYFAAQYWRRSWVPLLLIFYSGLFILEVLVARFGTDKAALHGSAVPRYVFDAHLWIVGVAWIAGLEFTDSGRIAAWHRAHAACAVTALALVLSAELFNANHSLHFAPFQAHQTRAVTLRMRQVVTGQSPVSVLPKWVCPSDEVCAHGIDILKKYDLNVARLADQPPPG